MRKSGINTRVLLVAVIPLTAIVAILALHFITTRIHDVDRELRDRGQAIARQLAPACEYGVFAGNKEFLAALANSALKERDVVRVTITGADEEVLARATRPDLARDATGVPPDYVFRAPILQTEVRMDDFSDVARADQKRTAGEPRARTLGWITVELTNAQTAARQRDILVDGLMITLSGLLLTALVAQRMARGVTRPILTLTRAVDSIKSGNLDKRVAVESGGELGRLESGINAMADALAEGREREQQRAADALYLERVRAQVTLESIGDGVITADDGGKIIYLNPVAEQLTGWRNDVARGLPLTEVFKVIDERTSEIRDYPLLHCLRDGRLVRHDNRHTLIRKDGRSFAIQDSAAPIKDRGGSIIGAVVVFHDITEIQHMASKMAYLASHDPLTGLLNRHEFEIRLQQVMENARSGNGRHAVCYMDLDQFKIVNDTCGHVAGDELLKQMAHRLQKQIRATDVLARLGGDEFGVILEDCPMDRAFRIAEDIRQSIKDFRFAWQSRSFDISVSIGMVPISADSGSMTDVLSAADSACYVAKDHGRNRVHIYQPDDDALAQRHGEMQWVHRLNEGLANDRFQLHCQEILPLNGAARATGRLFEILVRLYEADIGLIPPTAFIPAGERYYLMPAIDRWVVASSLNAIAEWRNAVEKPPGTSAMFSINLSGQSLCDDQFLDFVVGMFGQTAIDPRIVCFEITETAAIANLTRATYFIATLKEMGCRFALDDFGSGLSSFGYLKNLPVDFLKIAGSFIQDIAVDPVDHAMVDAINQIGHVMGLMTIAESVENDAILKKLTALDIDYGQGFGLGGIRPLRDILDTLRSP